MGFVWRVCVDSRVRSRIAHPSAYASFNTDTEKAEHAPLVVGEDSVTETPQRRAQHTHKTKRRCIHIHIIYIYTLIAPLVVGKDTVSFSPGV